MWTWKLAGVTITMASARVARAAAVAPSRSAGEDDSALQALAAELRSALTAVEPRPIFRKDLGRGLAAVARQRRVPRIVVQQPRDYRRDILIGAAAVSSAVSVAGLVALIWHHRGQQPHPA